MQPFINGIQHAWASVKFNILGRTVTGITAIAYGDKSNKENLYGEGDEPIGRGEGNKDYDKVVVELYQYEVVALQKSCGGDITKIPPFDGVVQFKETLNTPKVTDIVQNLQFMNNTRDLKQGDTSSKVKLELICAGIKWHSI